jgi:hypothetical protein
MPLSFQHNHSKCITVVNFGLITDFKTWPTKLLGTTWAFFFLLLVFSLFSPVAHIWLPSFVFTPFLFHQNCTAAGDLSSRSKLFKMENMAAKLVVATASKRNQNKILCMFSAIN